MSQYVHFSYFFQLSSSPPGAMQEKFSSKSSKYTFVWQKILTTYKILENYRFDMALGGDEDIWGIWIIKLSSDECEIKNKNYVG
jgi:hypothetical protein